MGTKDGTIIATIITTHMPTKDAAAPDHVCPGTRDAPPVIDPAYTYFGVLRQSPTSCKLLIVRCANGLLRRGSWVRVPASSPLLPASAFRQQFSPICWDSIRLRARKP